MKKGVWRSDRPPQYFDLPCFCQHLYFYLNTLFHLSLYHGNKKKWNHPQNISKAWSWPPSKRKIIFGIEIITVWVFSKRGDGSLYIDVPLLFFYDQGLVLGHTFQSTLLCWHKCDQDERKRKRFPLVDTGFNLLCAPVHIEQISKSYLYAQKLFSTLG